MNLSEYLSLITTVGVIVFGLSYAFAQWKNANKGISSEVITTNEKRIIQLKEDVQVLSLKVATMEGQMIEKDKKLQEFTTIFQGRDPELKTILTEIRDFMKALTAQSNTNQSRNESIDKDTLKQKGNPMTHEVK